MVASSYKISFGLDVSGPATATTGSFSGLITGTNGLSITGSTTLGPTLHTGAAAFNTTGLFSGLLSAAGGLAVTGTSSFSGAVTHASTGAFSGLLTAGAGLGVIGNATVSGNLVAGGAVTTNGLITANGGFNSTTITGSTGLSVTGTNGVSTTTLSASGQVNLLNVTPIVENGSANLSSADGASTLQLVNSNGGDVAISFDSLSKYGLKLGINNVGGFYMGGWTDGASTFRMIVDSSGNLTLRGAVATTSINSTGTIVGKGNFVLRPSTAGAQQSYIFQDTSGNNLAYLSQANNTVFLTANSTNANNLSLDSNGNLFLIGTGYFHAGGDVQAVSLASTGGGITLGTTTGNGANAGQITYANSRITMFAQGASLYLTTAGNGYIGTAGAVAQLISTTPSAASLKENVTPHTQSLDKIKALSVIRFNYTKASGLDASETHVGFIAEDVQEHVPHAYTEIEGTPSIFLTKFVPDLWLGVQQLIDWNNGLERRLNDQTKRNDDLEARLNTLEAKTIN